MADDLPEPKSRKEQYLAKMAGMDVDDLPEPASRKELYLAKAAGMSVDNLPTPASREELYLNKIAEGGGGGGGITSYGTVKYTENGVDKTIEMATEEDFLALTLGGAGNTIKINNTEINKDWIKEVTVGDGVGYLPDRFCYGCNYITSVNLPNSVHYIGSYVLTGCLLLNSPLNLQNVHYIGSNFLLQAVAFNQPISLPKVDEIADNFMTSCSSFNSAITLNDGLFMIGSRFLYGCSSFAQPFTVPNGLLGSDALTYNPGERFMHNCNSFVGPLVCNTSTKIPIDNYTLGTTNSSAVMYTNGVTLTGPYAEQWKAALSDRTSSPYRKLIVD